MGGKLAEHCGGRSGQTDPRPRHQLPSASGVHDMNRRTALTLSSLVALAAVSRPREALAALPTEPLRLAPADGFVVEYYYTTKWGHFDEFVDLYVKNHLPILRRYQQMGRILSMSAAFPVNHASEAARWDMRFTIVWKDAATAYENFAGAAAITRELYPDEATFKREEQQRFQLLVEHLDVPVILDDLATW